MYFDLKRQRESNLHLLCQRKDPEAIVRSILLSLITLTNVVDFSYYLPGLPLAFNIFNAI